MQTVNANFGILDQAKDLGLQVIEITHSGNDYPKNLGDWGVIGFEDIENAMSFADEFNGEVNDFQTKNGWHFWNAGGKVYSSYNYHDYLNKLGDDYSVATIDYDYKEILLNIVKNFTGDFDELDKTITEIKNTIEKVEGADEDEVVIVKGYEYFETVKKDIMQFSEDGKTYAIGVLLTKELLNKY